MPVTGPDREKTWRAASSQSMPTSGCRATKWFTAKKSFTLTASGPNRHPWGLTAATAVVPFTIDDYTAWRLLEGLDDIGLTLRKHAEIAAFESARPA